MRTNHSKGADHARKGYYSKLFKRINEAFEPEKLDAIGREVGFMQRERKMPPSLLVPALVGSLGGGHVDTIAELREDFVRQTGVTVEYGSFHERLDRDEFASLSAAAFVAAAEHLILQALRFSPHSPFACFSSVRIQDGTSFALHQALADAFPGRFKKNSPAAVELHATFDLLAGTADRVALAPDVESERRSLPLPGELAGTLFLADRGYPSYAYLVALDRADASFVMRVKANMNCAVMGVYENGELSDLDVPMALSRYLAKHPKGSLDLVVQVESEGETCHFRFVALPTNKGRTYLLTNLPQAAFSAEWVGLAYRLRWQVELEFKAWKSYANLHRFATASAPIAEGLIWLSLLVGLLHRFLASAAQLVGKAAISMLKTAKLSARYVPALMQAVLDGGETMAFALKVALDDLLRFGRRAHPKRDRHSARGQAGLVPAFSGVDGGRNARHAVA